MRLPNLHERELQRLVRGVLSDSMREWQSVNGTQLQILSVGEWNHAAGPDFLGVALAAEGRVHVGNAEFHRTASDWLVHEHSSNPSYSGLLLHIVVENNSKKEFARYTLVVEEEELIRVLRKEEAKKNILETKETSSNISNHAEIQELLRELALKRLYRKRDYAVSILNPYKPHETLLQLFQEFANRQLSKKRRPRGIAQIQVLRDFLSATPQNTITTFLEKLSEEDKAGDRITTWLTNICKERIATEGAAMRQELVLNIILPLGMAMAKASQPIVNAFETWYLALPTKNSYAALQQRFPHIVQEFVYQQQGLLEYCADVFPEEQNMAARPSTSRIQNITSQGIIAEAAHSTAEYVITLYAASRPVP